MRRRHLATGSAVAALLACCSGPLAPGGPPRPDAFAALVCPQTAIRSTPFPGLPWLRWVEGAPAAAGITGHLFYGPVARGAAALHVRGTMPDGSSTKILWLVRRGGAETLSIVATRLGGRERTHQVFPLAGAGVAGYANYPSIVVVPSPGCWRFRVASGRVAATVTLRAVS